MSTIQGVSSKRTNKLSSPEVQTIFKSHDLILFTERWSKKFTELHVENFDIEQKIKKLANVRQEA